MKIRVFLITTSALRLVSGTASDIAPEAWFNWVMRVGALNRLTVVPQITEEVLNQWLSVVQAQNCSGIIIFTKNDQLISEYREGDRELVLDSVAVDMLNEVNLRLLHIALARPENSYLAQWTCLPKVAVCCFQGWKRQTLFGKRMLTA